ncbi:MAG: methyl-accepting chemotaxis protein, partial [Desulfobulbaceae bacterium]|nr:methyl-accepting chemotaxis protein [Desulfobulbaceae bacterium]
ASEEIASASNSLAEGTSEQAASLEETSASLEQMSSQTNQNSENASQADTVMQETKEIIATANDSMLQLTVAMDEITAASEETSKINKTIDEIAFQTNLLALNAAVEAARAGDAGAGFAVVAEEVRSLAMRSAVAASDTEELIETTMKKVTEGGNIVKQTNDEFQKVAASTETTGNLLGEINIASKEQARGIVQINTAIVEMDKVTQANASNAEQTASASQTMSAQAKELHEIIAELTVIIGKGKQKGQPERPSDTETDRKLLE